MVIFYNTLDINFAKKILKNVIELECFNKLFSFYSRDQRVVENSE